MKTSRWTKVKVETLAECFEDRVIYWVDDKKVDIKTYLSLFPKKDYSKNTFHQKNLILNLGIGEKITNIKVTQR